MTGPPEKERERNWLVFHPRHAASCDESHSNETTRDSELRQIELHMIWWDFKSIKALLFPAGNFAEHVNATQANDLFTGCQRL